MMARSVHGFVTRMNGFRVVRVVCVAVGCVMHAASAQSQPNPPRAQLVQDLRLDAEREDFARIARIHVGPDGQMAIPELTDATIKLYNASGTLETSFGRKGRGPGEFTFVSRVGWIGDTMWVSDMKQRRISWFTADGKLIRTQASPVVTNKPVSGISGPNADRVGFFVASHMRSDGAMAGEAFLMPPGAAPGRSIRGSAFVRVSIAGDVSLLARLPNYSEDERFYMSAGGLLNPIPFVEAPMTAVSSDATHIAHVVPLQTTPGGGTVSVALMRNAGDTVFHTSFPYRGEPIPKAVRDSAIAAQLTRGTTEGASNAPQLFHAIAKRKTPHIYAGASFVVIGLDHTVWVGLHPTHDGQKVLVFNQRGDAEASVILPKRSTLRQASARHIWVTETDEDGLNSVVRYRVAGIR